MGDQPLVSSKVAWLQSRARRRVQVKQRYLRIIQGWLDYAVEAAAGCDLLLFNVSLDHQNQKIAGFASSYV
jgi:hypothetical protein